MTSWQERFDKHAIWPTLEELRSAIDGTALPEDGADRDTMEFVRSTAERLRAYKTDADPIAFTPQLLSEVEAPLRVLVNAYRTWQNGQGDYKPVDSAVDGVILAVSKWPAPTPEHLGSSTAATVESMSEAVTQAIQKLSSEVDDLTADTNKAKDHHSDLVKEQGIIEERLNAAVTKHESTWNDMLLKKSNRADEQLAAIEALRDEARNMVHESTSLMVGAEYLEYAAEKKHSAWIYDALAVLFGAIGLVTLYLYIRSGIDSDASVAQALTRLGITAGALIIGGFLAKRGGDQHREAKEARRTALALSRMAPFIANLGPDARELLTIETADRIFTRGDLGTATERESIRHKWNTLREQHNEKDEDGSGIES